MVARGKAQGARLAPAAHLHVAAVVRAHGHALVRQVGHGQQQGLQLGLDLLQPRRRLLELQLGRRHLGLGGLCARLVALAHEHADLLGELVALGLQFLGARLQRLALGLQGLEGGDIEEGLRVLARVQALDRTGEVLAEEKNI